MENIIMRTESALNILKLRKIIDLIKIKPDCIFEERHYVEDIDQLPSLSM